MKSAHFIIEPRVSRCDAVWAINLIAALSAGDIIGFIYCLYVSLLALVYVRVRHVKKGY